jgi:DNA polymerase (family X)
MSTSTQKVKRYDQECKGIPPGLIDLMSIPGLGPKTLASLHRKFHVTCLDDLKTCLDKAALVKLKGFGQKKIDNINAASTCGSRARSVCCSASLCRWPRT